MSHSLLFNRVRKKMHVVRMWKMSTVSQWVQIFCSHRISSIYHVLDINYNSEKRRDMENT